jgi:hypothetical protein
MFGRDEFFPMNGATTKIRVPRGAPEPEEERFLEAKEKGGSFLFIRFSSVFCDDVSAFGRGEGGSSPPPGPTPDGGPDLGFAAGMN